MGKWLLPGINCIYSSEAGFGLTGSLSVESGWPEWMKSGQTGVRN